MENQEILKILQDYNINSFSLKKEIDSSNGDDYRLNIITDKKYVIRINNAVMSEERLESISRLVERYNYIKVRAPRILKNKEGKYLTAYKNRVCYVSEYIDCPLLSEVKAEVNRDAVRREVLRSVGRLSKEFSNYDLSEVMSMWSIIDLAPLDNDIDEKQENLNLLRESLLEYGEYELAEELKRFNDITRKKICQIYKDLPRCVIQGDLNDTNILVDKGHFAGLIDFNMSGTEVNVNHFCCETNVDIRAGDFLTKEIEEFYSGWIREQQEALDVILSEYELNDLEKEAIGYYRSICEISMYPNVMRYIDYMKRDKGRVVKLLRIIISS